MARATRSRIKQESVDQEALPTLTLPSSTVRETRSTRIATSADMDYEMDTSTVSTSALEALGSRSRELIQAIQRIGDLQINSTLPSLPKFVVVGDQSAGKSSIIEALCDINLPRSQGTCTKCPFKITTRSSQGTETWKCTVSLHRTYAYTPNTKARKQQPSEYDNWTKQNSTSLEFKTITDKEHLGDVLKRAQLAILNPKSEAAEFLTGQMPAQSQLEFSPNAIELDITGPGLPELSFYDLPGAINVHRDENKEHLVTFIERLMKNYLGDEKALVLLAVTCDQDTETSTAFRFVGQCKAIARCMGVLTKPDLLGINRVEHIASMLSGKKFKVGHGWFVTKQLSQAELDGEPVAHGEARLRETNFFSNTEPWCSDVTHFADRFGIPTLQNAISQKLTQHIINNLPEMMSRVESKLTKVNDELVLFPEQVKEPMFTVLMEITRLNEAIAKELSGDGLENKFSNQHKMAIRELRDMLQCARPRIFLETPGFKQSVIDVSSDEDYDDKEPVERPSKSRKGLEGRGINASTSTQPAKTPEARLGEEKSKFARSFRKCWNLEEVRKSYEKGSVTGIPGQQNPKVTNSFITQALQGWPKLVLTSLDGIQEILQNMLRESVNLSLEKRSGTELFRQAHRVVEGQFLELMNVQRDAIGMIVACELHKPITYANELLHHRKEIAKHQLNSERLQIRVDEHFDLLDAHSPKKTRPEDRKNKATESWAKDHLKPDGYANQVDAMVTPLAYYDVASARLVDGIANHLELGVINRLQQQLAETLREHLHVTNSDYCAQLLAEDPEREAQRRRLLSEKGKLEAALQELQALILNNQTSGQEI